jgi:hypothetical protein
MFNTSFFYSPANENLNNTSSANNNNNNNTSKYETPNALVNRNNNNQSINSNSFNASKNQEFVEERDQCIQIFDRWSPMEQTEFVEDLLRRMCHFQHGHINNFLKPMLQRDFISSLPGIFFEIKFLFSIIKNILTIICLKSKGSVVHCRNYSILFGRQIIVRC